MKQLWVDPLLWPGQPAPAKSGWSFGQSCHTLSGALLSGNASWITIQPSLSLEGKFCDVAFPSSPCPMHGSHQCRREGLMSSPGLLLTVFPIDPLFKI